MDPFLENLPPAVERKLSVFKEREEEVLIQVATGLRHMHQRRVLHRDIKPANVFICARGGVKLGDMGLSRVLGASSV